MKKKIALVFIILIICIAVILSLTLCLVLNNRNSKSPFGVWWWDDSLDYETFLNFAEDNNINEIYFCSSKFNDETANFISKANSRNIEVYWLAGEYQWLDNNTYLLNQIDDYIKYQENFPNNKFTGIHLDIEPHQNPNFKDNRTSLILKLIDLAQTLKILYPNINFDYDIPFWLNDKITYKNQTKPAYQFMIDIADRVFVMSYRDNVEDILDIAKEEIDYAKKQNKPLFLSLETYSTEGDNVSYMEEGSEKMLQDIDILRNSLPSNFGIAIHHIKRWKDLD